MSPLRRYGPDLVLGAVAALGLAPFGFWPATPAALCLLIWRLVEDASARNLFWRSLFGGIGWFGLGLSWIVEPFLVEPEIYGWMAPFALVLMAIGGGLFWAVPVTLASTLASDRNTKTAAIVVALVLSDWLRGWIFTGFPWGQLGQIWVSTPVAQFAAWFGTIGLTALTLIAAAMPVILCHAHTRSVMRILAGVMAGLMLIGVIWVAGMARMATPAPDDTTLQLRIVQPNADQRLKWDPEWSTIFFQRLLDLSSEPGPRDVVIWPETAVNFLLEQADDLRPVMAQAAGATLLFGIQRREDNRYYNSLAAIAKNGDLLATYDKFHLVPFGEYIPWGNELAKFGVSAFASQSGNGYASGRGPTVLSLEGIENFQPLICYEAVFSQHLRGLPSRPAWLLQVTNDSWFGKFSGPYQHLAQARLRAIETGLPLIRAANTGVSAVIDARGQVRNSLPLGTAGKIDAMLPGALPPTLWVRWGSLPVVSLAFLVLLGAAGKALRAARRQNPG